MNDDEVDGSFDRDADVPAPGPQDEDPEGPTRPPGLDETKVKTEVGEGSEEQAGALRNCAKLPAVAGERHKRKRDNDTGGPSLQCKQEDDEGDRTESMPELSASQMQKVFATAKEWRDQQGHGPQKTPYLVVDTDEELQPPDDQPPQRKKAKPKRAPDAKPPEPAAVAAKGSSSSSGSPRGKNI